ncbi:sialate O-acetylesterase [Haloferula sp. A504]|uniref:sialate O-acetylesterase n=1 Tax=Haloferula sp. A504 TaxID=3373601 RepID=UPI0031C46831|nr:hypothetical protein [Verrucomicrobiaceae bacterium E54]
MKLFSILLLLAPALAAAEPTLEPRLGLPFRDHAVLQQKIPLPVWGTTLPGAEVRVTIGEQGMTTVADDQGAWRVTLLPMNAGRLASDHAVPKGLTLTATATKDGAEATTRIEDVLIGEVWLCAGQSNMAGKMRTNVTRHFPTDSIERASYPAMRQMVSPQDEWLVCSPETAPEFKKVCFFFGRKVFEETLVPVGLINAAVGGSKIEPWLNQKPYQRGPHYESMIEPLVGYGLGGVLWYQGESNAREDGIGYLPKLKSLITGWRAAWKQGDFPVYYVQLPGIGTSPTDLPAMGDGRAGIRQAYFEALELPNTGMAIALDIGDEKEHPPNKYDTGVRLAHLALHHDYGFKDLVPSGPLYKEHAIEGKVIRIRFDHAEGGLMIAEKEGFLPPKPRPDAKLGWLSIQAKDGTWHWAEGKIDGSELVVSSPEVSEPVAVRYAYTNHPVGPLLYNKAGLPTGPFRTDDGGETGE